MKANINNAQELIAAAICPATTIIEVQPTTGFNLYRARYDEDNEVLEWFEYDNSIMCGAPDKVTTLAEIEGRLQDGGFMVEFDHPIDHLLKARNEMQSVMNKFHRAQFDHDALCGDAYQVMNKAAEKAFFPIAGAIEDALEGLTLHEYSQQEFGKLIADYLQQAEKYADVEPIEVQIQTEDDLYYALKSNVYVFIGAHRMVPELDENDNITLMGVVVNEDSMNDLLTNVGVWASIKPSRKYLDMLGGDRRYPTTHTNYVYACVALDAKCHRL